MTIAETDYYAGKVRLGRMVLDAAGAAIHDDSNPDFMRLNSILACEAFVSILVDNGCMITRIPTDRHCDE